MAASGPAFSGPSARIGRIYWLLAAVQACHSAEEMASGLYDFFWVVTGRIHQAWAGFPQMRMDPKTFAILNMLIIAFLFGTVPFVSAAKRWALAIAGIAAAIEIANGIGHLAGAVWFGGYVPGAATAPFLIAAGVALLRALGRAGETPDGGLLRDAA